MNYTTPYITHIIKPCQCVLCLISCAPSPSFLLLDRTYCETHDEAKAVGNMDKLSNMLLTVEEIGETVSHYTHTHTHIHTCTYTHIHTIHTIRTIHTVRLEKHWKGWIVEGGGG